MRPPLALLAAALLALAPAAALPPKSPLTLRFYAPGALLVGGDGTVSLSHAHTVRMVPDASVDAVVTSTVSLDDVLFLLEGTANAADWTGISDAPLALLGTDEAGRRVFTAALKAPTREGLFTVAVKGDAGPSEWQARAELDVTCSNGIFCDGPERFVDGECMAAHQSTAPCVYGRGPCDVHECLEETRSCSPRPLAVVDRGEAACAQCSPPGLLSRAAPASAASAAVSAAAVGDEKGVPSSGSCSSPKPLFGAHRVEHNEETFIVTWADERTASVAKLTSDNAPASPTQVPVEGVRMRVVQKSAAGFEDVVRPTCAGGEGVRDVMYEFEIVSPFGQGFEVLMLGYDEARPDTFVPDLLDTLVAIHEDPAQGCEPHQVEGPADVLCSDDAALPGGTGSRVFGVLKPGIYTIAASFFTDRTRGAFQLLITFTDATSGPIRPVCSDRFCGLASAEVNGVQAECGLLPYLGVLACESPSTCEAGRCASCEPEFTASPDYVSTCSGRECGTDLCGLACGEFGGDGGCPTLPSDALNKSLCETNRGVCVSVPVCDHLAPLCAAQPPPGRSRDGWWCGTDCQWHSRSELLVDLVASTEAEVTPSINYGTRDFFLGSCAIAEDCIGVPEGIGPGENFRRKLMRFATFVHNVGGDFKPPPIPTRPDLFMWSDCHEHYHFGGFAGFSLLYLDEGIALPGQKLAFCMLDSFRFLNGPAISCSGESDCGNQGIQRGWSDVYSQDLDCQWLDVTEVPSDWYILRICVNFERRFQEATFDNNCDQFPVWVPPSVDSNVKTYASFFDGSAESVKRCQDLYDRTAGKLRMPVVCDGLYEASTFSPPSPPPPFAGGAVTPTPDKPSSWNWKLRGWHITQPVACDFNEDNPNGRFPPGRYTLYLRDHTGNGLSYQVKVAGVTVIDDQLRPTFSLFAYASKHFTIDP